MRLLTTDKRCARSFFSGSASRLPDHDPEMKKQLYCQTANVFSCRGLVKESNWLSASFTVK
jgi:hypothetical protein